MQRTTRLAALLLAIPFIAAACAARSDEPARNVAGVIPTMRCGDLFVAETTINDQGPFWLALDTGASATALTPETARTLGTNHIRSLRLGELELTGRMNARVHHMNHLEHASGLPIDGVLGHTVFKDLLLTYDYPAGEIRYRTGELSDDDPGVAPMARGKRPFIGAEINGTRANILLDTGSNGGLSIGREFDNLTFETPPVNTNLVVRFKTNETDVRRAARLDGDAVFGAFAIERPIIESALDSNLLGTDILRQFVVTIDQNRGRVQMLTPDGAEPESPIRMDPLTSLGAALRPTQKGLVIDAVFTDQPESPAAAAGLQPGDLLVAFNNIPWTPGICDPLEQARRPQMTATIDRDGERFDVELNATVIVP